MAREACFTLLLYPARGSAQVVPSGPQPRKFARPWIKQRVIDVSGSLDVNNKTRGDRPFSHCSDASCTYFNFSMEYSLTENPGQGQLPLSSLKDLVNECMLIKCIFHNSALRIDE